MLQGVLLARMLGPAGRGEFAAVILWPSIFAGLGMLGVNMAIARFAGQGLSLDGLVRTATKAAFATGFISALACWLALPTLLPQEKHHLLPAAHIFLFFIPINHLGLNLQGIDHGTGNFVWLNVTRALLYPVFFTGIVICWWVANDKVFWVAAALLLANSTVVLLRLVERRKSFMGQQRGVDTKKLINSSLPFATASGIAIIYMQMDKALLVWLLSPAEIGWYMAAFAAAGSINVLNNSLGIMQFSTAAQAEPRRGFPALASMIRRGSLLSILSAVVLATLLPMLVPLVYGADFKPATGIASFLLPGLVLAGLGEVANQALRGQGQPVAGVVFKVLGLVAMGLVGAALAASLGGVGIACGYMAGELVAFLGLMFVSVRYYQDATWFALRPTLDDVVFLWALIFKRKESAKG